MRYIELEGLLKKRNRWRHRAELWTNPCLKDDFRNWFYDKCWYTEAMLAGSDMPIDHFRPKAAVKQYERYDFNEPLKDCGYFWLKNDPSNYRVSCTYANRVTGTGKEQGGKGTYFPLCPNSPLLTENGTEEEKPLLLDPCNKDDVCLLSFLESQAVPVAVEGLERERAETSIKLYNLNNTFIKAERVKVWDDTQRALYRYKTGKISREVCLEDLKIYISRDRCYSACAIACINALAPDELKKDLDLTL